MLGNLRGPSVTGRTERAATARPLNPVDVSRVSVGPADPRIALGRGSSIASRIAYKSLLFSEAWVRDFFSQIVALLEQALRDPARSLSELTQQR
jgi:hypothetical protein